MEIGLSREDMGVMTGVNQQPGTADFIVRLEWLIEYIPNPDYAWYLQLARPNVPITAVAHIQDIISASKKFVSDDLEHIEAKSHKIATMAGINKSIVTMHHGGGSLNAHKLINKINKTTPVQNKTTTQVVKKTSEGTITTHQVVK